MRHGNTEQKKAALRRVEMELDEADEMVCPLVRPASIFTTLKCICLLVGGMDYCLALTNGDRNPRNPSVLEGLLYLTHQVCKSGLDKV